MNDDRNVVVIGKKFTPRSIFIDTIFVIRDKTLLQI